MSADVVARDQLRAFIERIERVEEEIATLNADKSDIYKEARSVGFDVKVLRKVIAKRKLETHVREEQDAIFDLYWEALYGAPVHVHTHTRENIEEFDAETGEVFDNDVSAKLVATVATGLQTETGRKALVKALDIMIERKEAEERRSDLGLNILTKHEDIRTAPATAEELQHPVPHATGATARSGGDGSMVRGARTEADAVTAGETAPHSPSDDGAIAAVNGKAGLANANGVEPPSSGQVETPSDDDADHAAAANAGGDHVDGNALRVPTSNTGEGAANTALPTNGVTLEYVPASGVKRLPFFHCFPELSKADYDRLEKDIAANRVQTPIIRQGDVIIDGWARYMISRQYGMSYPVVEYTGTDILLDVIELQRAARNFTPAQEKKIAADLAKELPHRADEIIDAFGLAEEREADAA